MAEGSSGDKPAILQETEFIVEEGILHRTFRTGAIWLNKLFFSSAFLWALWLVIAYVDGAQACSEGLGNAGNNSTDDLDIVADGTCSVLLTPTSKYLGAMTVISFLLSVTSGLLGLVVGKRVLERTATADEVGSEERSGEPVDEEHDAGAGDAEHEAAAPDDPGRQGE